MRRSLLLALLAATAARAAAAPPPAPEVVWDRGVLSLRRVPDVLSDRAVARHLGTGLTTRFAFTLNAELEGRKVGTAAQVHVRYDLWDERYLVERWDARGDSPAATTLRRDELPAWWRALALVFPPAAPRPGSPPARAKVELLVLPFSQAEQRDAQDWLLRAFRAPEASPQDSGDVAGAAAGGPLRAFYGALLAASIRQRSLVTYTWTVDVSIGSR